MKCLFLLLVPSVALATSIESPQIPQVVPVCGQAVNQFDVGEMDAQGTYPGVVLQRGRCSGSGRAHTQRYYAACIHTRWDANGVLLEHEVQWSTSSLQPITLACF